MARIAFDTQGVLIGGRRAWLVGAALEYSLMDPADWSRSLSLLRQAGFNTIRTSVPWSLHEPRRGARRFDGPLDLRRFVEECAANGLWVILRLGPCVGGTFGGGGLPSWLSEVDGLKLREPQDQFLRLVAGWYDALLGRIKELSATGKGAVGSRSVEGGIVAIQVEHGWNCGHPTGTAYLRELRRLVREGGFELPILTSNGLWTSVDEATEIWEGDQDLFSHARQLRQVQPGAPVIVEIASNESLRRSGRPTTDDAPAGAAERARTLLTQMARVLSAGGQPIVAHAAPEVHHAQPSGADEIGGLCTDAVTPLLVERGGRAASPLSSVAALALFASRFGGVLSGSAGNDSIVIDPDAPAQDPPIVISRASSAGAVAFVIRAGRPEPRGKPSRVTLVTASGLRLPVHLGTAPVTWVVVDLDLQGKARLDYSALAPVEFVEQSMLVLRGVAGTSAPLSIGGSELLVEVPGLDAGAAASVLSHAGLTLVVCNEAQAATIRLYGRGITIGARSIAGDGSVELAEGFREAVRIEAGRAPSTIMSDRRGRGVRSRRDGSPRVLGPWRCADALDLIEGTSDRYASIETPRSLAAYAPSSGLGWYRLRFRALAGSRICFPEARGSLRMFLDGRAFASLDGMEAPTLELPAARSRRDDERTITALAIDRGRPIHGLHEAAAPSFGRGAWLVRPLRPSIRRVPPPPFDPFARRIFVPGAPGAAPDSAIEVTVRPAPRGAVVVHTGGAFAGAVLVNGALLDMVEIGVTSIGGIVATAGSRGSDRPLVITLVPLDGRGGLEQRISLWERLEEAGMPSRGASGWSFARWEPPPGESTAWHDESARRVRRNGDRGAGTKSRPPCWWRTPLPPVHGAASLDLDGLSRGVVLLDGAIIGRYDARTDRSLPLPAGASRGGDLVIFDEEGASPDRVRIVDATPARSSRGRITPTSGARSS